MCMGSEGCSVLNGGHLRERKHVSFSGRKERKADHADAEHIASWNPLVAVAVAGYLETEAHQAPGIGGVYLRGGRTAYALSVARAYLGEPPMTDKPDTDPAAILAGIKERAKAAADFPLAEFAKLIDHDTKTVGGWISASALDVPPLVAALEAVLKLHQPGPITIFGSLCKRHENHRHFSIDAREAADVRACQDCEAAVYNSCNGCGHPVPVDECLVREAITAALTGKEAGDAGT